jgi:GT2 family glycosyltransferase
VTTSLTLSIVLFDSAMDIEQCLIAVRDQQRPPDSVVIIDNGSNDDGAEIARRVMSDARIERLPTNLGFAAAHNLAIAMAPGDIHAVLNPDCRLGPAYLRVAEETLARDAAIGSMTGRLLRYRDEPDGGPLVELDDDILDSTGMVAFRNRRVLDRGSDEPASGRYPTAEDVFGASGAAAAYRRDMLEDVAFEGEFFDEHFFTYREDVDLAWRALLLGWRCRYEPAAVARHRRRVTPGRRRQLPNAINRRSVANRWRMLAKNELGAGWRRDGLRILARDLGILGYAAVREQTTLAAVFDVARDARRLRAWRRDLMRRRAIDPDVMLRWFEGSPPERARVGSA